ncbi:MAG: N-acyl-D-glutamate amidohydrolase [Sandaracinus sp.]|nr:N-acyl-D-glutamate amidohydrolase [Sandaracinus sp.]
MRTLVRRGRFFDGLGSPSAIRDVLVEDGHVRRISAEPLEVHDVDRVIDAEGLWVMPGFIDNHTHYDAELLVAPGLKESVRHGVTTVFMGSCSLSTVLSAPEDCADFFARVEALPREHVLGALEEHQTWSDPAGYVEGVERLPLGPNVGTFLGHSDLRVAVMGLGRSVDPAERPTAAEQAQMESILEAALDEGFLGLSTMTNPWDKVGGDRFRSKRLPSTYATWGEYRRFHRILRRRGAILQSAPNITTKVNALLFALETAGFGLRETLKTTLITATDAKASPGIAGLVVRAAGLVNRLLGGDLRWQTVPMPFEVYADGMDLVVFEEFGASEAALHLADEIERNALLQDEAYRRWFRKDYEKRFTPRVWQRDFHDAEIVAAPDTSLVGRSFGALADERGIHPVDLFLDLVVAHGSRLRWKTTIGNHRPDVLRWVMKSEWVQPGFADSGAHVRNMAFYNFPLHLLRAVVEAERRGERFLSLEQAVHKLTGAQADWYGVDAGRLREGDRADLVVVDPAGLDASLDAYAEAPMEEFGGLSRMVRRNDRAVRATMIAGDVVFAEGRFAADYGQRRHGSFLRAGRRHGAPREQPTVAEAAE